MKFKSLSAHILAFLGLSEWSKVDDKNSITVEEVAKLKNYVFTEKFLTDFKASLENDFQDEACLLYPSRCVSETAIQEDLNAILCDSVPSLL